MKNQREGRASCFHHFAMEDSFRYESNNPDAVLIVDVGGGRGHDMEAFKEAFPNQRGRLVVQDLPTTIDEIRHLIIDVKAMKHDFFISQSIKNKEIFHHQSTRLTLFFFFYQVLRRTISGIFYMTVSTSRDSQILITVVKTACFLNVYG